MIRVVSDETIAEVKESEACVCGNCFQTVSAKGLNQTMSTIQHIDEIMKCCDDPNYLYILWPDQHIHSEKRTALNGYSNEKEHAAFWDAVKA